MEIAGGLEFVHCLLEQVLKRCLIGSVSQCVGGREGGKEKGIFIDVHHTAMARLFWTPGGHFLALLWPQGITHRWKIIP